MHAVTCVVSELKDITCVVIKCHLRGGILGWLAASQLEPLARWESGRLRVVCMPSIFLEPPARWDMLSTAGRPKPPAWCMGRVLRNHLRGGMLRHLRGDVAPPAWWSHPGVVSCVWRIIFQLKSLIYVVITSDISQPQFSVSSSTRS